MVPLSRRQFIAGVPGLALMACRESRSGAAGGIAFSLSAAERIMRGGGAADGQASTLAGMNGIVGLVFDSAARDAILVGRTVSGAEPLALDDLVAAIRARLVRKEWPLVTIERTPDTVTTGRQEVRFEGGVAGTGYGAKLLAADVTLKQAALGLPPGASGSIPSYFDRCAKRLAEAELTSATSRFWFHAADASLLARENVFVVRDLKIGVEAVGVEGSAERDDLADGFAADFSQHYSEIAARHVEVARLKPLFDLVAIGNGMESLPSSASAFWTREYSPRAAATPAEHPLVERREQVSRRGRRLNLELSGGVDTRIFARRLQDGDCRAFQEAVLQTRPRNDSLWWRVPISAWFAESEALSRAELTMISRLPGTVIRRDAYSPGNGGNVAAPNPQTDRGGVSADIPVSDRDVRKR
jgi:hypothetical protein